MTVATQLRVIFSMQNWITVKATLAYACPLLQSDSAGFALHIAMVDNGLTPTEAEHLLVGLEENA